MKRLLDFLDIFVWQQKMQGYDLIRRVHALDHK